MNDVERWINLEGPEPPGIRELLDAARDVPEMPPELAESLDRELRVTLDAQRRRWDRERTAKRVLAAVALAAVVAGAGATAATLVLRSSMSDAAMMKMPGTSTTGEATTAATSEPAARRPARAEPSVDAGAPRRPGSGKRR